MEDWEGQSLSRLAPKLAELSAAIEEPDLWSDNQRAQSVTKQQSKLSAALGPWIDVRSKLGELQELVALGDESLADDIASQFAVVESSLEKVVFQFCV